MSIIIIKIDQSFPKGVKAFYHLLSCVFETSNKFSKSFESRFLFDAFGKSEIYEHKLRISWTKHNVLGFNVIVQQIELMHESQVLIKGIYLRPNLLNFKAFLHGEFNTVGIKNEVKANILFGIGTNL